jgi:uncharacterized lipoprotein YehR (DUF1307 family)
MPTGTEAPNATQTRAANSFWPAGKKLINGHHSPIRRGTLEHLITDIGAYTAKLHLGSSFSLLGIGEMLAAHSRSIMAALYSVGFLISITSASSAQLTRQEKEQAITTLSSEINRSIQKQLSFPYLRDKVVRQIAECAFLFKTLENASPDPEVKRSFAEASDLSQEVAVLIAAAIPTDRYEAIIDDARYSVVQRSKHHYRKELLSLLRSCKSFNDVKGVDWAVQELTF